MPVVSSLQSYRPLGRGLSSLSYTDSIEKSMSLLNASITIKLAQSSETRQMITPYIDLALEGLKKQVNILEIVKKDSGNIKYLLDQLSLIKSGRYDEVEFENSRRIAEKLSNQAALELNMRRSKAEVKEFISELYQPR